MLESVWRLPENRGNLLMNIANLSVEDTTGHGLSSLTHDELAKCARLLAISVAHHRAKFGVVPIATSSAQLARNPSNAADASLSTAASKTLTEALELVRVRDSDRESIDKVCDTENTQIPGEEKRRQVRISVTTAIKISDVNDRGLCDATLRNISWGGAAVCCNKMPVGVGGRICLLLPTGRKRPIKIFATVLRKSFVAEEEEYGLRFDSLDPEDEDRLLEVLKILIAQSDDDGRRSEVRLVQRLEVEYGDTGEFKATLEDISAGGLMLTVPDPLEVGQSLLISLSSADTPFALNLRAKVVHQTAIGTADIAMYRVGLEFERSNPQLRDRIAAVVTELAIIRDRDLRTQFGDETLESVTDSEVPA